MYIKKDTNPQKDFKSLLYTFGYYSEHNIWQYKLTWKEKYNNFGYYMHFEKLHFEVLWLEKGIRFSDYVFLNQNNVSRVDISYRQHRKNTITYYIEIFTG